MAMDNALSEITLLTNDVLATAIEAEAPISTTQKTLAALSDSFAQLVAGRGELAQAQKRLIVEIRKTNQAETDFGCWHEGPLKGSARTKPVNLKLIA